MGRRNEDSNNVPEADVENVVGRPVNMGMGMGMTVDTNVGSTRTSPLAGGPGGVGTPAPIPLPISDADILLMERVSRAVQDQLLLRYQVRAT